MSRRRGTWCCARAETSDCIEGLTLSSTEASAIGSHMDADRTGASRAKQAGVAGDVESVTAIHQQDANVIACAVDGFCRDIGSHNCPARFVSELDRDIERLVFAVGLIPTPSGSPLMVLESWSCPLVKYVEFCTTA